jgi:hypothetical protein
LFRIFFQNRECLGEAHAPLGCEKWREWQDKCKDVDDDEVATGGATAAEEAANSLWLVANSKPCPNCHSPIQKNDGCNHMKCSKVSHVLIIDQHMLSFHDPLVEEETDKERSAVVEEQTE